MRSHTLARRPRIAAVVALHLVICIVHGAAHDGAYVPLSRAGNLFVFAVIVAGPLAGLALMWPAARLGGWVVALTMAGSLAFGLVNHFVIASPDHVMHVVPQWRPLFGVTAALLALTEAIGATLGIRVATERTYAS